MLELTGKVTGEQPLKRSIRKGGSKLHGTIVDVILRPQPEAYLHKGDPGIAVILLRESAEKLEQEPSQLRMRPILR